MEPQGINYAKIMNADVRTPSVDLVNPAGTTDYIYDSGATGETRVLHWFTSPPSATDVLTYSYFLKRDPLQPYPLSELRLRKTNSGTTQFAEFFIDLSNDNAVISPISYNHATAENTKIVKYPNGWYRISHTITA